MATNENLIPIPGRLHSVASEHHVAGADEIYDDTLGKDQATVNSDVNTALGQKYVKPSTGIPSSDMSDTVQASLGKADAAAPQSTTYTKTEVDTYIGSIEDKIPSAATSSNQLADKNFVNSSISTSTATFRGTSNTGLTEQEFLAWANALTKDDNDYVFWNTVDSNGNTQFKRYKYNGTAWTYEYTLNNSSFTSDQWAAIQSGITSSLVGKLSDLPTDSELDTALGNKQDTLVSGTNIKTINNQSLVGSGDITITGNTADINYDTTNKKITKTINGVVSDVVTAEKLVTDGGAAITPEVEIGSTTPTEDVKIFVDESEDPASSINVYNETEVDTLLDEKLSNPIEITSLSADYTFKNGDTLAVGTGLYKCNVTSTTTPPFDFVFDENGSIVIDSINGYEAVVVDSDTLNTGWEKVMDVSDRHYTEMRLSTKADKATTLAGYGIIDAYTKNQIDALTRHTRLTDFDLNVLKQAVADQNLEKYGLKVGDEKTINGHTYVIAGLNPMKGPHSYRVNTNHVGLIVIPHTIQAWNVSNNTYTGADGRGAGYMNSDLHYYLKNTVLPMCNTDLGASNLLGHSKVLSNAVNQSGINRIGEATGCSSGWDWESDCKICALSEVQIYGATILSSSGYDTGEACRQLEVFQKYSHTEIFGSENPWLRDVVSASKAAVAYYHGHASSDAANCGFYVAALILFH